MGGFSSNRASGTINAATGAFSSNQASGSHGVTDTIVMTFHVACIKIKSRLHSFWNWNINGTGNLFSKEQRRVQQKRRAIMGMKKITFLIHSFSADRVAVSMVLTTPNIRRLASSSSLALLLGTESKKKKIGAVVVAETKCWIKAFRSAQRKFNLVLNVLFVVIGFGAAVVTVSFASIRCLVVMQKKKNRTYSFFPTNFLHRIF